MVQHVARVVELLDAHRGHGLQPLVEFGERVAGLPPAVQAVVRGLDHQRRRGDARVERQCFVDAEDVGVDDLVRGLAEDLPARAAVGLSLRRRPVAGQPVGLVLREARVGLHEAARHAVHRRIARERLLAAMQALELVDPLAVARGRLGGLARGHAEAFEVDEAADARRAHARVVHGDVAAHAVAHEVDRAGIVALAGVVVEQPFEVGQVVRQPVVVDAAAVGEAEAAPVGRDDEAVVLQRIDHELPGGRHVHPAMHQHQRRALARRLPPEADVVVQVAHGHEFAARGAEGLVHMALDDTERPRRAQSATGQGGARFLGAGAAPAARAR
ncbi:hypothetical protein D3C72_1287620 [compost metagenome]